LHTCTGAHDHHIHTPRLTLVRYWLPPDIIVSPGKALQTLF